MTNWARWAREESATITAGGRWRSIRESDPRAATSISFGTNDYLGLAQHPAVIAGARAALERWGASSTSSRLVTGTFAVHSELEAAIAAWKGCDRALVFPSGYSTNLGVLATLGEPGVTICSDELNHASIIDACRLARAEKRIYRHLDLDHLAISLGSARRSIVVTETVFSMDGDRAPLTEIAAICAQHESLLVIDEAHCVLEPDLDLGDVQLLRIGTLSKALGSQGGFVAGPAELIELLINRARTFIFSTGLTPAAAGAALAALQIACSPEGNAKREHLKSLVEQFRPGHPSQIIPIVIGEEAATVSLSQQLLEHDLIVPAIRPPSVPVGSSRLRISLSSAHSHADVARLVEVLTEVQRSPSESLD
jgi:8-amino-7-oxononanoate synthase